MPRHAALLALMAAAACAGDAEAGRVRPTRAARLEPIELSDLVAQLIPPANARADDWRHAHRIRALTWDPQSLTDSYRLPMSAHARVRVSGRAFRTLPGGRGREILWEVETGPNSVSIGLPDDACIDTKAPSCIFPESAWRRTKAFTSRLDCRVQLIDGVSAAYRVHMPGRRNVEVVYVTSGGSGGDTSWLEIDVNPQPSHPTCAELQK